MANRIAEKQAVPTTFAQGFLCVDEEDAESAGFQAPKKENRWALLELDNDQLAILETGQTLHIKEHSMGSTAFCIPTATYGLEFLENSNPMYLGSVADAAIAEPAKDPEPAVDVANKENVGNAPSAEGQAEGGDQAAKAETPQPLECTIFAQCRGNLFLKPGSGDVQRLRDLLVPNSIDGGMHQPGSKDDSDQRKEAATTAFLQYQVAASPKELKEYLDKGPYVERDGVWHWLPAAFEREVTDVSLNLIPLHGWDVAAVETEKLLGALREHFGQDGVRLLPTPAVLRNALRGIVSDSAAELEALLVLDPEKIKLFQATQLLREAPSKVRERFDLPPPASRPKRPRLGGAPGAATTGRDAVLQVDEFCAAFSAQTGGEATIEDLSKLVGDRMYIDEMDGAVHTLDVTTLPQEPKERLKRLFELSSHWKPDRLSSLMSPVVHGVKIDVWLLKQCRTVYIEFEKGKELRMFTKKFTAMS